MTGIPTLTLHQPWASLIAIGAKRIETRSWRTNHRGPIAIHAAKTFEGIRTLPGDCEGNSEGGWRYGYIGDYQASFCFRSSDEGRCGDAEMVKTDGASPAPDFEGTLPLGAIVATAQLVDCVPIVDRFEDRPGQVGDPCILMEDDDQAILYPRGEVTLDGEEMDVSRQVPYGGFTPGRWAWLLEDIQPTTERCPACWGMGMQEYGEVDWCKACDATGRCAPIPAKGKQGIWRFEP